MSRVFFPELSIVVCTHNRVDRLRRCVAALLSVATTHNWELIVVDNDSNDGTKEYLNSINSNHSDLTRVKTTFEEKLGLAAARNKGWRTATGDIVAFTDDDCYVSGDYVDSILQVFSEDSRVGFLGGRILLFDALDYRITIQESRDSIYFRPRAFVAAGAVQGANMAFRRSVLELIGGFDERLGAGTRFPCEDIDAVASAL